MADAVRVVVCDDEPITRTDIREMLEEAGYLVVGEARDGISALKLCETLKPDVVVLDIKMPGVDGLAVARRLDEQQGESGPAVVMVTAYRQQDLIDHAAETAVDAYLLKPIAEEQLVAAIKIALARRQALHRMQSKLSSLDAKLRSRKLIDRAKGILMAQEGLTEEQAYNALRFASMNLRLPIEEIARDIVSRAEIDRCLEL